MVMKKQRDFINSILYNQVPVMSFCNQRTILSCLAMVLGFTMVTFVLPFYSQISQRPGFQLSLMVSVALIVFYLASLLSIYILDNVGPKKVTWAALILAVTACALLSKADEKGATTEVSEHFSNKMYVLDSFARSFVFYFDGAAAGYLLVCISAAFLSTACFQEVMNGTEEKL